MFTLDIEYIHKSVEITFSKADNVYCARLPDKRIEMFQEKNLQTAFTHSPDGGLKFFNSHCYCRVFEEKASRQPYSGLRWRPRPIPLCQP